MCAKSISYLLGLVLILFMLAYTGIVAAQTNIAVFQCVGVTLSLKFQLEAHPGEVITHNMTICNSGNSKVDLANITLIICAPIDSTLEQIGPPLFLGGVAVPPSENITATPLEVTLPQNTSGTLSCYLYVETEQFPDFAYFTFFTTQVHSMSYSELLAEYNELLTNHSKLIVDYQNLLYKYNGLLSELDDYHALQVDYSNLQESQNNYNKLNASYEYLSSEFKNLTDTHESLQENYTILENEVADLEKRIGDLNNMLTSDNVIMLIFILAIVSLVAFVVYIKRKKQEPYLVIRKETVAINEEKKEKGAS